jgi:hypothetical protein
MVKDRVAAALLTVIILYFCIRTVMFLYGVVLVVSHPLPANTDTTYSNYPELDRRNLKSQLKYHENNKVKTDSTRSK